jgi:hypothetical protein
MPAFLALGTTSKLSLGLEDFAHGAAFFGDMSVPVPIFPAPTLPIALPVPSDVPDDGAPSVFWLKAVPLASSTIVKTMKIPLMDLRNIFLPPIFRAKSGALSRVFAKFVKAAPHGFIVTTPRPTPAFPTKISIFSISRIMLLIDPTIALLPAQPDSLESRDRSLEQEVVTNHCSEVFLVQIEF